MTDSQLDIIALLSVAILVIVAMFHKQIFVWSTLAMLTAYQAIGG